MEQSEFKFPDEGVTVNTESSKDDFSVEIVDDTPPQDRGRVPLPKEVLDKAIDDSMDEYSDKVKSRINQLRKGVHDERREKETATREREEALRFAQQTFEENRLLKQRLGTGEKVFISEVTKAATTEVAAAKENMRRAYAEGDPDKIADAQDALTDAKLKLRDYQQYQPTLQEVDSSVQRTPQTQPAQRVPADPKAESWRQTNTWFGADEEMTALALGLHEKLVRSGVDSRSDDYYRRIDETMKKRFPEYFGEDQPQTMAREEKPVPRKTNNVVAPATRSTAPRQVRLTSSEAALAKRLGLTPEAYAREKIKLESNNG